MDVVFNQQLLKALKGLACADDLAPAAQQLLDRRDGFGDEKGGCHDHAAGDEVLHGQVDRKRHLQRGQGLLQEAAGPAHDAGGLAGVRLHAQVALMALVPAPADVGLHAQRQRALGVLQALCCDAVGLGLGVVGDAQHRRGDALRGNADQHHRDRGKQDEERQVGMKKGTDDDEQNSKRRAHERQHGLAGKKLAHLQQVAQHLVHVNLLAPNVTAKGGVKGGGGQIPVHPHRDAHHQAAAHPLQR